MHPGRHPELHTNGNKSAVDLEPSVCRVLVFLTCEWALVADFSYFGNLANHQPKTNYVDQLQKRLLLTRVAYLKLICSRLTGLPYRDPSIQIIPTLGPKVCKYYPHWAIWIPRAILASDTIP